MWFKNNNKPLEATLPPPVIPVNDMSVGKLFNSCKSQFSKLENKKPAQTF